MHKKIGINVNGTLFEREVKNSTTLLHFLRYDLGLTGTKEGCGEGCCGACSVLLDGNVVNSCCILAVEANGKSVVTIEGLARGEELHPLQKAFVEAGAVQCGFCTPGMILSALALLNSNPDPTDEEIKKAISGNLCRCTGYIRIIEAVRIAGKAIRLLNGGEGNE